MKPGTRIRRREEIGRERSHLRLHARSGHVGVVQDDTNAIRVIAGMYVLVRFDGCRTRHRLLPDEVEAVRGE